MRSAVRAGPSTHGSGRPVAARAVDELWGDGVTRVQDDPAAHVPQGLARSRGVARPDRGCTFVLPGPDPNLLCAIAPIASIPISVPIFPPILVRDGVLSIVSREPSFEAKLQALQQGA